MWTASRVVEVVSVSSKWYHNSKFATTHTTHFIYKNTLVKIRGGAGDFYDSFVV